MIKIKELRKKYDTIVHENLLERENIDALLNWIGQTDYFDAPASAKHP